MTIEVENLQMAIKYESHVASFAALFWVVIVVEHMSPSNNNTVILRLLATTMLLYSKQW